MLPIKCWYRTNAFSAKWQAGKCMGWGGECIGYAYAVVLRIDGDCIAVPLADIRFGSKPVSKKKAKKKGKSK